MAYTKSFRVKSSKFVFDKSNNSDIKMYANASEMWNDQIEWDKLKSRIYADIKGSPSEAAILTEKFNYLAYNSDSLYPEEKTLLLELFGLLNEYIEDKKTGVTFEERFEKLLISIFNTGEDEEESFVVSNDKGESFDVGTKIIQRGSFQTGRETASNAGFYLDIVSGKKITNKNLGEELKELVNKTVYDQMEKMITQVQNSIQDEKSGLWNTRIFVRDVKRQGKADISTDGKTSLNIREELSPEFESLAQLLSYRTFSLKSYLDSTIAKSGVSLGGTAFFKALSSFYQYATGSQNFPDTCTFIFSSKNSRKKDVKRFVNWARFIYELTGVGQQSETDGLIQNGRLVDYLVVLNRTTKQIDFHHTSEFFKNMPNEGLERIYDKGHIRKGNFVFFKN